MAEDRTALIVATKHLAVFTAGDGQLHVAFHVGILRTAIDGLGSGCTTAHDHD